MSTHRISDINRQRVPLLILWHEQLIWLQRMEEAEARPAPFDPWADVIKARAQLFAKERGEAIPF